MADLSDIIDSLRRRVTELERRQRSLTRTGIIEDVDPANGKARVRLLDADPPFLTGWLPWEEPAAGANKTHNPPSVGQQVRVQSESGDLYDATIQSSVNSDANARPSAAGDEYVLLSVGQASITVSDGGATMTLTVGASSIVLTDAGIVETGPRIDMNES